MQSFAHLRNVLPNHEQLHKVTYVYNQAHFTNGIWYMVTNYQSLTCAGGTWIQRPEIK